MRRSSKCSALFVLLLIVTLTACGPTATLVPPPAAPTVPPAAATTAPTATVPPPTPIPPTPTATVLPPTATPAATVEPITAFDSWLSAQVDAGKFAGAVLIARNGEVLLSKGYGLANRKENIPNTPQTKYRIYSITKSFTAMAILILDARGELDVQDLICNYVSDCPAAWKDITLHHLLTHTSGVPDALPPVDSAAMTPEQLIDLVKDKPLDFLPGTKFSYCNAGYFLLGYVIEQVSGLPYEEFVQQNILEPLEMRDTGFERSPAGLAAGYAYSGVTTESRGIDNVSNLYGAGALYSTVEDLYRWDQALYTEQLVPQELLDLMFTAHWKLPKKDMPIFAQGLAKNYISLGYGYGWIVGVVDGHRLAYHSGLHLGYTGMLMRYPNDRVTMIFLSNLIITDFTAIRDQVPGLVLGDQ